MIKLFSILFLLTFTIMSFAQHLHSVGPAPVSENKIQYGPTVDAIGTRAFTQLSTTPTFQFGKLFLEGCTPTNIGTAFAITFPGGLMYRNGVVYTWNQSSPFQLWSIDTVSGVHTPVFNMTGVPHANFTGMYFDGTNVYGVSTSITESQIFTVNMTNGVCTPIGTPSTVCPGAISLSGRLDAGSCFSVDIVNDRVYKWNKTTGVATALSSTLGVDANFGQDACFDNSDGVFYWASQLAAGTGLRIIDTTTGVAGPVLCTYTSQPTGIVTTSVSGPQISHTGLPSTENTAGPYVVNAVITPAGSPINASLTKLFWSRNSTTVFDSIQMTNTGGNNWTASIPGNNTAATYRYYMRTVANDGRVGWWPAGAPTAKHTFLAGPDTQAPIITHTQLGDVPITTWPPTVTANVVDPTEDYGGLDSVWVRWYKNTTSNGIIHLKLNNTSGSTYAAPFNQPPSYVAVGDSIFYKIFARDNSSNHNVDSTALYKFKLVNIATACIGTGTTAASWPFNTFWHDSRTQFLYTPAEITAAGGAAGNIFQVGFTIISAAAQSMEGFNIRMQHTTLTSIDAFVSTGWTTVYTGTYTVPGTGLQYITLQTGFNWNGTSNLLMEICFDNTSYTSATTVNSTAATGMCREYHTDGSTGCTMTGGTLVARPNTCFKITLPVGIPNVNLELPKEFALSQNYPNPFNPTTSINYYIPKASEVSLTVYDITGKVVATLVNEFKQAGSYNVNFNASALASGMYLYKIKAGDYTETKKMVLIK